MASPSYNRAAAFVEYSKGTALDEISHALAIPMHILERWCHEENWAQLAPKIPQLAVALRDDQAERAMERIKDNREKNLAIAQALQQDLLDVIEKLRTGKLKTKKVFAKGLTIELEPTLRDRCDLALYARNVAEMSYRALGDVVETAKNTQGENGSASAGQITIILPPAVAAPREERAYNIDSEVLTLPRPAILGAPEDAQASAPPSVKP